MICYVGRDGVLVTPRPTASHRPCCRGTTCPPESSSARSARQSGPANPNWRGGRSIASNGYVLIRVGVGHPLADVRGYVYEHRLVATKILGRPLAKGELVHHRNGDKTDNRPENLEVVRDNAEHFYRHRKRESGRRMPGEDNPIVRCECGCGAVFLKFDMGGRPRRFVSGHNTGVR